MAREIITLACTECKERNYTNKKNKLATTLAPTKPIVPCSARKILGKKEKIIPTDESFKSAVLVSGLNEKIAGRISKPAIKATAVSVKATILIDRQFYDMKKLEQPMK